MENDDFSFYSSGSLIAKKQFGCLCLEFGASDMLPETARAFARWILEAFDGE